MRNPLRHPVIAATVLALAATLAACGEAGGGNQDDGNSQESGTIGLLLPDDVTERYDTFDRPYIEAKIEELCPDCDVQYSNAGNDTSKQRQQFDALLTSGAEVIILDPVDAEATASWVEEAQAEGVPVIAYDRLAEGPVDGYVSYDNERVGQLQGQALLDALGDDAEGADVVMINGSPTDPNAAQFKRGAHAVLDDQVNIVFEQDVPGWEAAGANQEMSAAIDALGPDGFDAVYVGNDGMAAGVVNALEEAGIEGVPVGGQDAELATIQRIVAGQQTFTIYKAPRPEAEIAAEMAVRAMRGEEFGDELAPETVDSGTAEGIPSQLLEPVAVTVDNIADTVIADDAHAAEDICRGEYAAACEEAGLG
jgi:D-xylose transport system substrate-binding protein